MKRLRIFRQELQRLHRNPFTLLALYVFPLLLTVQITMIYHKPVLTKLGTVVVDQDQSRASRTFVRLVNQSRFISVRQTTASVEEGFQSLRQRKNYVMLVVPVDFEKHLKKGEQPVLRFYGYGANLLLGKYIQKAVSETVSDFMGRIEFQYLVIQRGESGFLRTNLPAVKLDTHNLYNPGFNYQWFLPPGAILSVIQLLVVLIAATTVPFHTPNLKTMFIHYVSRLVPILSVFTVYGLLILGFWFPVNQIPVRGDFLMGMFIWEMLIVAAYSFGYMVANLIGDLQIASVVCSFIMAPAFAFSGYTYPVREMPVVHQIFAMLMPTTHVLPPFIQFYMQGSGFSVIGPKLVWIILYWLIVMLFLVSADVLRTTFHRVKAKVVSV